MEDHVGGQGFKVLTTGFCDEFHNEQNYVTDRERRLRRWVLEAQSRLHHNPNTRTIDDDTKSIFHLHDELLSAVSLSCPRVSAVDKYGHHNQNTSADPTDTDHSITECIKFSRLSESSAQPVYRTNMVKSPGSMSSHSTISYDIADYNRHPPSGIISACSTNRSRPSPLAWESCESWDVSPVSTSNHSRGTPSSSLSSPLSVLLASSETLPNFHTRIRSDPRTRRYYSKLIEVGFTTEEARYKTEAYEDRLVFMRAWESSSDSLDIDDDSTSMSSQADLTPSSPSHYSHDDECDGCEYSSGPREYTQADINDLWELIESASEQLREAIVISRRIEDGRRYESGSC